MKIIEGHRGKKKGETGITIHIYSQGKKIGFSKTITVHGMDVNLTYAYIKFWFDVLSISKSETSEGISIETHGGEKNNTS